MDRQIDSKIDRMMGGQANEWIDIQYKCIDMQKTMIPIDFATSTKGLQTDGPSDGPMDQLTYGDAIAASKNNPLLCINYSLRRREKKSVWQIL